ncbi:MAG: GNAT family N-acetyltransferase [bacterium]|nr:GNAT family N-acetyltransferase [bacterium]
MEVRALTLDDRAAWADLLALTFERTPDDMGLLLDWLHDGYDVIACGAFDGDTLAAQYACLMVPLRLPGSPGLRRAGMSLNMSVHPEYRGQGMIKQVSKPVYERVQAAGGIAGFGFSNAEGVQVDRKSKGYGYQVVGRLRPSLVWFNPLSVRHRDDIYLTDTLPLELPCFPPVASPGIYFDTAPERIAHRYAAHPFRRYRFGLWEQYGLIRGIVAYRPVTLGGIHGAAVLGAYGDDLPGLLRAWAKAAWGEGLRFAHVLTTPRSALRRAFQQAGLRLPQPISRSPYYLTVKPLGDATPPELFDFGAWDCMGGDIL